MATPATKPSNVNISIADVQAGSAFIKTFNADGSVLDVSSGFTLSIVKVAAANQPNSGISAIDLSSHMTPNFTSTGLGLSWTAAQAATMVTLLQSLSNNYVAQISNDSGTTNSIAGFGTLTINPYNGLNL